MLAQIDAQGWVLIIGAFFVGLSTLVTQILTMILTHYKDLARDERERTRTELAKVLTQKVDEVRTKADSISKDVLKVEIATNSMKDQLVQKTEQAGMAKGVAAEREKAMLRAEAKAEAAEAAKPETEKKEDGG